MRYKVISFIITVLILSMSMACIAFADDQNLPDIHSPHAIILEADRGQIVFSQGANETVDSHLAATIMTALIAIETPNKPEIITISSILEKTNYRSANISIGEKYNFNDLINILILENASDIALIIADSLNPVITDFETRLNEKAKALGLNDTVFYLAEAKYAQIRCTTTLKDLSSLLIYSLKNPTFKSIFTSKIFLWHLNENESKIVSNSNDLIWKFDNVTGGMKNILTSFPTAEAITSQTINNMNLICIVSDTDRFMIDDDTDKLLKYTSENFRRGLLTSKSQILSDIIVNNSQVNLSSNVDVYYTYPIGHSFIEKVTYNIPDNIPLPISKNISIGSAIFHLNDGTIITVPLFPDKDIQDKPTLIDNILSTLKQQKDLMYVIFVLLIIEGLVIIYKVYKKLKSIRR